MRLRTMELSLPFEVNESDDQKSFRIPVWASFSPFRSERYCPSSQLQGGPNGMWLSYLPFQDKIYMC